MQRILYFVLTALLIVSCKDKEKTNEPMLLDSSGHINNVSVVVENELWNGQVGDAVRNVLAAPIYGLPQDEPLFTLSQIPPSVFSGFVTKSRAILKIEINKPKTLKISDNVYAQPQKVITVSGTNRQEIVNAINENAEKIVNTLRNGELAERSRQMAKSPHNYDVIKEKLGLTLQFASVYRIGREADDFFWFRKDITTGTTNLLIYDLPLKTITPNDSIVNQIIKIRDSIGKQYIEGSLENTYMVTEDAYAPFIKETIIDNKPAYETKGIWDLKNGFMGGPFINYAIEDKANNRWVIIEGFAFAPSVEKRDYMLELEAIIKSVKIE
ncbi:MAG: DUF4837 family protein [Flavobacteriaceae bacterium]